MNHRETFKWIFEEVGIDYGEDGNGIWVDDEDNVNSNVKGYFQLNFDNDGNFEKITAWE